jgi:hypothetical protein
LTLSFGCDQSTNLKLGAGNGRCRQDDKQRSRVIANNEAGHQTTGDIRVSAWAVVFAVIITVIGLAIVGAWLDR